MKNIILQNESGFSMIELLIVTTIIGILSASVIQTFTSLKGKANYTKANSTFRDSKNASTIFSFENPNFTMGLTYSATSAGILTGTLFQALPGVVNSSNVRIGLRINGCTGASQPTDIDATLNIEPCNLKESIRMERLCSGFELQFDHVNNPDPCT